MKRYMVTYYLMPDANNVEITVFAKSYEDACVYAKGYRRESFGVKEITAE